VNNIFQILFPNLTFLIISEYIFIYLILKIVFFKINTFFSSALTATTTSISITIHNSCLTCAPVVEQFSREAILPPPPTEPPCTTPHPATTPPPPAARSSGPLILSTVA